MTDEQRAALEAARTDLAWVGPVADGGTLTRALAAVLGVLLTPAPAPAPAPVEAPAPAPAPAAPGWGVLAW